MEETIKILLVEDDEVDRMAVHRALKASSTKAQIIVAINCQSALSTLQQQNFDGFDCVLLDYRLPDGDGLTLVQEVRGTGSKIPLVVLTGQGDEQTAVELMKAGASDYLAKSKLSSETLTRSVRNAVRIYRAEKEAARATKQLRDSEERYRLVLEGSNDGIWDWDIDTHQIYCNDRLYEITGFSATEVKASYELFCRLLHPEDRLRVSQALAAHLQDNAELEVEFRLLHTSGEYRYCIARGKAWRDLQERPFRISGIVSDITERKRAEESLRFLAEASAVLSASLDYEKTLSCLVKLAVPFIADVCFIDVVEDGVVRRLGIAQAKSQCDEDSPSFRATSTDWDSAIANQDELQEQEQQLPQAYRPKLNQDHPVIQVLQTGRAKLVPEITREEWVEDWGLEINHWRGEKEELSQDLPLGLSAQISRSKPRNFQSYMIVPLSVRGRTLGAISFVSTQQGRRYKSADLALADELARRAALSLENGQLYRETQETSENLRQAILILGEQQQQLRTLQQLTNLLNQRLTDLPGLLREMVGAVANAIPGAQFCFIMLNNPQCNGLVLTVTAGADVEKLRLEDTFSPKHGLLSQVFTTGESQLIQGSDCTFRQLEKVPAAIYAVAINAPVLRSPREPMQSGRLGILAVGNWDDRNAFDEEDRNLLVAVGEQAAIAIDNARMIKALEEQEKRLEEQNERLAQQNQELESHRQQLQLQNVQLLEAARLKSQFLATMSHELRTPMNAVIGFSQLLLRQRQHPLTSQQADMLERILSNGKHLLALINEILDLSKIESGRLDLKLEAFNVATLVQSTCAELYSLAQEKHLALHVIADLKNTNAINDSARLRQVLVNLISNAIKFTETGSISVEVQELSVDRLVITVKDTGIGISPEELEHIFEEFRQIDQTITRKYAGTGLGLAITKSLVQLMQGTIEVESQLTQGSTFRIELPRTVQSSTQNSPRSPHVLTQVENVSPIDRSILMPTLHKHRRSKRMLY